MRLVSTRNPKARASFTEAVQACVPGDGGLYVPEPLPCFRDTSALLELDFPERTTEILFRMLGEEFTRDELAEVAEEAFAQPLPLKQLQGRIFALELFHGPSLAFQDLGIRFLAGMLALISDREGMQLRTVLTATTGNTGAAVAQAFWKRKGIRAVVLHPKGIPELLEHQIAGPGANVLSYAVDGSYDDCQALVERCLQDPELRIPLNLTSANSLNIGRLVGQVPFWFEAVARIKALSLRDAPVIALPCGNFGNLCSGLMAQRMGLPVKAFVAATNANDAVPRFLDTGCFEPGPALPTLSRSLDLGHPDNWERAQALLPPEALRAALRWGRCGDEETRQAMWELNAAGWRPDPHTAVAYSVLQERLGLTEVGILLATAHPAKSAEFLRDKMNLALEMPAGLAGAVAGQARSRPLPADFGALRHELLD